MPWTLDKLSFAQEDSFSQSVIAQNRISEENSEFNNHTVTDPLGIGLRVVPRHDSKSDESDAGGVYGGLLGTVVEFIENSADASEKMAVVLWDDGGCDTYKANCNGDFDLCIFDMSPSGIEHEGFVCYTCNQDPILGIRWNCLDCKETSVNLCSSCYMADEHNPAHAFWRYNSANDHGIRVDRRSNTEEIHARGIFLDAQVVRGRDWEYDNTDGNSSGIVTKITCWPGSNSIAVHVSWEVGTEGTYRLGHDGKVDLKCINAAFGGLFYKSHLPRLGSSLQTSPDVEQSPDEPVTELKSSPPSGEQENSLVKSRNRSICPLCRKSASTVSAGLQPHTRAKGVKARRSSLHRASINGDWHLVKSLLADGKDVDQRDKFLLTPLHLASWYGRERVVDLLLKHGANVNAVDRFQKTPLQKAERHNYRSIVNLLLSCGASKSFKQPLSLASLSKMAFLAIDKSSGFNMLQAAVYEGDYPTVVAASVYINNFLEQMDMIKTLPSARSFPGKTTLDIVSDFNKEGHAKIKQLYLDQKKSVAAITELHKCADDSDAEKAVELVLQRGIDVNIEAKGNRTPLLWASLRSSSLFFKTLIDLGADTGFQREDQCTPLMMATHWNNYMVVYYLTELGVDADVRCNTGHAALHVAVMKGFFHISNLLVRSRCSVTLKTKSGKTPLRLAVQNGHKHLVRLLLENSADANMRDETNPKERLFLVRGMERGRPAWYYVMVERSLLGSFLKRTHGGRIDVNNFSTVLRSGCGNPPSEAEITEMLNNSNEFRKDPVGKTPLHIACEIKDENLEVIELLVKHGGKINARDGDGFTPLQTAAILGKMQTVTKLVELKANVNLTTNDGKDAADLAQMNEEPVIEEYLKSRRSPFRRILNSLFGD